MRGALAFLLACSLASAQETWFSARVQEADGHWSAARFGGKAEADLRVNALLLLHYLAEGETAQNGPHRQVVRNAMRWLHAQQDKNGCFALRADPEWLLDHAMATYGVAEELRLAQRWDPEALAHVLSACGALCRQLPVARPRPAAEVHLWVELCARSLRALAKAASAQGDAEALAIAASLAVAADDLRGAAAKLPAPEPKTPRDRAAALLQRELAGSTLGDTLPVEWPADLLADPLTTFYVTVAVYLRGGKPWSLVSAELQKSVLKVQVTEGVEAADPHVDLKGSWAPVDAFGEQNGRLGTTAGAFLLMEVYYRYCRLELCSGN